MAACGRMAWQPCGFRELGCNFQTTPVTVKRTNRQGRREKRRGRKALPLKATVALAMGRRLSRMMPSRETCYTIFSWVGAMPSRNIFCVLARLPIRKALFFCNAFLRLVHAAIPG